MLTTRLLQLDTVAELDAAIRLVVNVKSDNGHCRIELLDQAGLPIAGYGKDDASDLVMDSVSAVASWNGKADVRQFLQKPVRLRFHLQNARLYSIRFKGCAASD